MKLAASARKHGVQFKYGEGDSLKIIGLELVPDDLRREILLRVEDVRAVVREHSVSPTASASDVTDAARLIVSRKRKAQMVKR